MLRKLIKNQSMNILMVMCVITTGLMIGVLMMMMMVVVVVMVMVFFILANSEHGYAYPLDCGRE
jgi:uncharacterized membrane protein